MRCLCDVNATGSGPLEMGRRMKRIVMAGLVVMLVASCGGRAQHLRTVSVQAVSSGPILSACMQAGRSGATRQSCGCVQAVANKTLSDSDQRLGASFFSNPHRAQEIRQSPNAVHSAFWKRWSAFGDQAAKQCK